MDRFFADLATPVKVADAAKAEAQRHLQQQTPNKQDVSAAGAAAGAAASAGAGGGSVVGGGPAAWSSNSSSSSGSSIGNGGHDVNELPMAQLHAEEAEEEHQQAAGGNSNANGEADSWRGDA